VVAVHASDTESQAVVSRLGKLLPIDCVAVSDRRVVPMLAAALDHARGSVIAATDDDAQPQPDWLARMLPYYEDRGVAGVGGRDLIHDDGATKPGSARRVGVMQWFGRAIYEHHRGAGPARDVDVLKGVNMSLRSELWRLEPRLRGEGALAHWELELCLRVRHAGWRLIYDPEIVVDHWRAPRVGDEPRDSLSPQAVRDAVHNEFYAIVRWSPGRRRAAAIAYGFLVGHRRAPGLAVAVERLVRERDRRAVLRRAAAAAAGRALALASVVRASWE
jgi:GT2 family glycosyltransferase